MPHKMGRRPSDTDEEVGVVPGMREPGKDNRKMNERCRKTHLDRLGILEALVEKSDDGVGLEVNKELWTEGEHVE